MEKHEADAVVAAAVVAVAVLAAVVAAAAVAVAVVVVGAQLLFGIFLVTARFYDHHLENINYFFRSRQRRKAKSKQKFKRSFFAKIFFLSLVRLKEWFRDFFQFLVECDHCA